MNSVLLYTLLTLTPTGDSTLSAIGDTLFTIHKEHQYFVCDKLDNVFVINKDVITRYQANGDSLLQQSFKKYGSVEYFDATQALRPVLFYASQSLAVSVDNTLSLQNEPVDLAEWNLERCTLMSGSNFNDSFWLFDNSTMELVRVDHTFKIINRSGNISSFLRKAVQPTMIREWGNRLYMYIPGTGIAVFDQYATYLKTIPVTDLQQFIVSENLVFYLQKGSLFAYDSMAFTTYSIINTCEITSFSLNGGRIYLGNGHKITVAKLR